MFIQLTLLHVRQGVSSRPYRGSKTFPECMSDF